MVIKLLLMISFALISIVFIFIHLGFALFFTVIYLLSLGVFIFYDSKKITKVLFYEIIPILFFIALLPVLSLLKALGEPATIYKLVMTFSLGFITYLIPLFSYVVYIRRNKVRINHIINF